MEALEIFSKTFALLLFLTGIGAWMTDHRQLALYLLALATYIKI